MNKQDEFSFSIYKPAPESFKAFYYGKEINLLYNKKFELGYTFITKGKKACLDCLKRYVKEQRKKTKFFYSIGFYYRGESSYCYDGDLRTNQYNLLTLYFIYQNFKKYLIYVNCKILVTRTAKLDVDFKFKNIEDDYKEIDISRPILVRLYTPTFYINI